MGLQGVCLRFTLPLIKNIIICEPYIYYYIIRNTTKCVNQNVFAWYVNNMHDTIRLYFQIWMIEFAVVLLFVSKQINDCVDAELSRVSKQKIQWTWKLSPEYKRFDELRSFRSQGQIQIKIRSSELRSDRQIGFICRRSGVSTWS